MHRLPGPDLDRESLLAAPWPTGDALEALQAALAAARPAPWAPGPSPLAVGAVFVCWPRGAKGPGAAGDPGWAGAAVTRGRAVLATATVRGVAGAPYLPGHLAAREGPLLAAAALALDVVPDVLVVNATGRDHPRRAGLALHLGAVLDRPTVGVTHRPLYAVGAWPVGAPGEEAPRGTTAPLVLEGEPVGAWLAVAEGTRPLAVHPGWRTDLDAAVAVVLAVTEGARTPRPLRAARQLARAARAEDEGRAVGPAGPVLARDPPAR